MPYIFIRTWLQARVSRDIFITQPKILGQWAPWPVLLFLWIAITVHGLLISPTGAANLKEHVYELEICRLQIRMSWKPNGLDIIKVSWPWPLLLRNWPSHCSQINLQFFVNNSIYACQLAAPTRSLGMSLSSEPCFRNTLPADWDGLMPTPSAP